MAAIGHPWRHLEYHRDDTEISLPTHNRAGLLTLSLGSIGVVYGDIGTSPLYAFREAMRAAGDASRETVLGVLSLITLGADDDRDGEIRADPAARRQSGRGWHAVAAGSGAARDGAAVASASWRWD